MTQEELQQVMTVAQGWLDGNYDAETKAQVKAMMEAEDKTELVDSFYRTLEFGTGGLRGIMGPGTNRMNKYIVAQATQGYANYLLKVQAENGFKNVQNGQVAVVVGHDCRNNGRLFAETVADIFSANGIKVYLFESLRPTPEVSFAIRELKCQGGVNVTASHNPREYNGYKAYWEDGSQVLQPHDQGIIDEVNKVTMDDVKWTANKDLIEIIGGEMDYTYMEAVKTCMLSFGLSALVMVMLNVILPLCLNTEIFKSDMFVLTLIYLIYISLVYALLSILIGIVLYYLVYPFLNGIIENLGRNKQLAVLSVTIALTVVSVILILRG